MLPAVLASMATGILSCLAAEDAPPATLTSAREIRSLVQSEAAKALPVDLTAVVTYSKPSIATLFVHDGTAGVFVEQPPSENDRGLQPGDKIRISGVTGGGLFAPVVEGTNGQPPQITVLSHPGLPQPRQINGGQLSEPVIDSDWVSIDAWVSEVLIHEEDLILDCQADSFNFHVLLEGPLPMVSVPWNLAESRVRIRGVIATTFNTSRQMTGRFLRVNSLGDIQPLAPAPDPMLEPPLVSTRELLRVDGRGPEQLVRVRGVATLSLPGHGVFLETDDGGLWVQTAQPVAAAPGTVLEVTGWPRMGEIKPFIRARKAAILGSTSPPEAAAINAAEALGASHDAQLVRVQAELLDSFRSPEGLTLELRDSGVVFRGLLPGGNLGPMPKLAPGSLIRLTGIARITPTGNYILRVGDKLLILASSASDLEILAPPPFWTTRNVTLVASAIISALLVFYGIARTRRRREQLTQRREFDAVLAERGRFAREIHDSLAQGLTSISMQLECVRDQLPANPAAAAEHVERARGLVRDSLKEARRTVWNLRPLALGEADLATALQRKSAELANGAAITCRQEIEGSPRPLPPGHEDALLRIGQEALTNAMRHAAATEIRQRIRFGPGWVTLIIQDNGKGFDVTERVGKGFGLTGMHERVAALGGSLSIDSRPGHGTEVSATLPT